MNEARRDTLHADDQAWIAYIDGEVRAVCEAKGWGHQIRRKWTVRETPVAKSPIDDYEWKLIDNGAGAMPRYELYDLWSDPDEATNLYPPGTVTAQDAFDRLQAELPG